MPNIIEKVQCILADKAYDAKVRVLDLLDKAKVQFVIPPRKNRKEQREYDKKNITGDISSKISSRSLNNFGPLQQDMISVHALF